MGMRERVSVHVCVRAFMFFVGVCLSACMHMCVCVCTCMCAYVYCHIVRVKKIYILYKYTHYFKTFSLGNVVK